MHTNSFGTINATEIDETAAWQIDRKYKLSRPC